MLTRWYCSGVYHPVENLEAVQIFEISYFSKSGTQKIARAISKSTKDGIKNQHRWIGFKNDRQSQPVCCLPDQILCQDGVQRNGSNADALVVLGTVSSLK